MKKALLIVLLSALGAAALGWSDPTPVRGSGNITTEVRAVGPFSAIDLSGIGSASIVRTGTPGLSISSDDNVLPLIISQVKDGTLYLSVKHGTSVRPTRLVYRVAVGDLREVGVSGAADLQAADLDGAALAVTVSGAGRVRLSGRTNDLTVDVGGAGSLDAAALNAKRAVIAANGAGHVSVKVIDTLDASAGGAGNIRYLGGPRLTTHVSGAGSVARAQ